MPGTTVVRLCGPLVAELDGRRVEHELPSRQGRLVFGYLVLERDRSVSRDQLIEWLWPARATASPEALLTGLLSRLRRVLPPDSLEGRSQLSLRLEPGAWVDVEVAEQAPRRAQAALADGDAGLAASIAREALAIVERPLLPEADNPWIDQRRRRLEELASPLLESVARAGLTAGGPELRGAEVAARRLIDREPLQESAHALLMEIHAAHGDAARALEAYEELRRRLRDELGTVPGPAIRALSEGLLRSGRTPAGTLPLPAPLSVARPVVGRADTLAATRGLIGSAKRPGLLLLTGEAGIGKSSVAAETVRRVRERSVLYGRCDEEPLAPYQPFTEALRDLIARAPDLLEQPTVAARRGELARLLPALGEPTPDGGGDRHRLLDAVAAVLVAVGQPLLLVIDDLHWADAPTLTMLRYLVRHGPGSLIVLATSRDAGDLPGRIADLAVDLRRDDAFERVAVTGLDASATEELIALRTGAAPHPQLVRRTQERTGGNPFFIEQLLRAGSDPHVPEGIKGLIGQRVSRLGSLAAEALQVAAVAGLEFDLRVVERVVERPETVVAALDDAGAAGLVLEGDGVTGRFAFTHALARDAIYEAMSEARRARLHQLVGEALEREHGARTAPVATELARHFAEAGGLADPDKLREYLVAAAENATRALAFESAAHYLQRALELPLRDRRVRFELLLLLGEAQQRSGAREPARSVLGRAASLAREMGDAELLAEVALAVAAGFDWYGFSYDADPTLTALLEEALAALPDESDDGLRVRVLARLALERYCAARYEEAAELSSAAVDGADRLGDDRIRLPARYSALFALDGPDDVERLEREADELVSMAMAQGEDELAFRARVFRLRARLQLADVAGVDEDVGACALAADTLRQPLYRWQAGVLRAMRALMRGSLEDGEREAQAAFAMGLEAGHADEARYVLVPQLLTVAALRGRLLDFEDPLQAHLEALPIVEPRIEAMLSWILAEGGSPEKARTWLDRCMARDPAGLPRHSLWLLMVAMLAEATTIVAEPAHAQRLLPLLRPYADRCLITGAGAAYSGAVSYYLGRLATLLGRWDDGERWFRMAVETEREMGAAPALSRAELGWAEMLAERDAPGDGEAARELAGTASARCRALGLPALTERAADAMATAGSRRRAAR